MMGKLFGIVILFWLPALATAGPRPVLDWLDYANDIENMYVKEDPEDTARNVWLPKTDAQKRVFLLVPSKSKKAYSLAVNTFLRGFHDAGVPARFDIWYYERDEKIAKEALDWAYEQPVDLIVSVGSSATSYLKKHHTGHPIPAVTSASKDPVASGHVADVLKGSGTNIAYTSISVEMDTLVGYLRRLIPDLSTIGVLYASSNSSSVLTQVKPLHASANRLKLNIVDISVNDAATAAEELEVLLPSGIDRMGDRDPGLTKSILLITGSTSVYEEIRLINSYAGNLPVISMLPEVVREGEDSALMSIGVNLTSALKLATHYAIKVVNGEASPGDLKVGTVSPPDLAINFKVAERVGVKIPMSFFESSTFIYDLKGVSVVEFGQRVVSEAAQ